MDGGRPSHGYCRKANHSLQPNSRKSARKTGALVTSVVAGAICASATDAQQVLLSTFATDRTCIQVMDDVLDVTATSEELGKTAGKDIDVEVDLRCQWA